MTYPNQLQQYKLFLVKGGQIYFKTDDEDLFNSSIKYLEEEDFKIISQTRDLEINPIWDDNIETEHEKMFKDKGIKIKALIAQI